MLEGDSSTKLTQRFGKDFYGVRPSEGNFSRGRIIGLFFVFLWGTLTSAEAFPVLLGLPVLLFVGIHLLWIREPEFTSKDMLCLCVSIFFFIEPCQTIAGGGFGGDGPASGVLFARSELIRAAAIVLLSLLGFTLSSPPWRRAKLGSFPNRNSVVLREIGFSQLIGFVAISVLCAGLYIALTGGLSNVLASRHDKVDVEGATGVISIGFLAIHVVTSLILAVDFRDKWERRVRPNVLVASGAAFALCAGLLVILVNPLNVTRFVLISVWLPISLGLLGRQVRFYVAYAGLLFGLLFLMPILSATTRLGKDALPDSVEQLHQTNPVYVKFVDVFDTLCYADRIVDTTGYQMGRNTTAVILFFVPRSLWPGKPIVGGLTVGSELQKFYTAGTSNLSFYFGGDLYMDFGYLGVLVGSFIVGLIWNRIHERSLVFRGRSLNELVLVGAIPILVRGPLGAVVGFFVCTLIALGVYRIIFIALGLDEKNVTILRNFVTMD